MVCKTGGYPYTYVTQSQASSLSQGMYNSSNFESDLINSYAWDTAIVFIQMFSGDGNYSKQVGENTKIDLQKCGESILNSVDSGDEAKDVRCNIYDMAGNTYEWTTETGTQIDNNPCVTRGNYYGASLNIYTSTRVYNTTTINEKYISFRPILYL